MAVWIGDDRKCSAAVAGLDLLLGLSMVVRQPRRVTNHFYFLSYFFVKKIPLSRRVEYVIMGG